MNSVSTRSLARYLGAVVIGPTATLLAQVGWTGTSDQFDHPAAYSSARQEVVTYGGTGEGLQLLDETRTYDGQSGWVIQRLPGPGPLTGAAMAATFTGELLFAGETPSGTNSSMTWIFDGSGWGLDGGPSPSARTEHALAFDSIRGKVVLLGGINGSMVLGDTWEWDTITEDWSQQFHSPSPPGVYRHAMSFDVMHGEVVLCGGRTSGVSTMDDTWLYNGARWLHASGNGPDRISGHAMASDDQGRTIVYVGLNHHGEALADTYLWNGSSWLQVGKKQGGSGSFPVSPDIYGRFGHSMTWDAQRRVFVVHGGRAGGLETGVPGRPALGSLLADSLEWDPTNPLTPTWTSVPLVDAPAARLDATAAANPLTGEILTFGGLHLAPFFQASAASCTNDFWTLQAGTWAPAGNGPMAARSAHAMCWDMVRQEYVIFGGLDSSGNDLDDVWTGTPLSGWSQGSQGPSSSWWTAIASTPVGVLLYGGVRGASSASNQCYLWDGTTWQVRSGLPGTGPQSKRGGHAMAYDARRDRVVMFGGQASQFNPAAPRGDRDETWEWDPQASTWTQQNPLNHPPKLTLHAMTYDKARERVVLFGGVDDLGQIRSEVWEDHGIDWELRTPANPIIGRLVHSLVYDHDTRSVVAVFGDAEGLVVVDPFEYGPEWPASVSSYGTGCPGPLGPPTLTSPATALPWAGTTLPVEFGNLQAQSLPFLVIGLVRIQMPLAPLGFPGCTQLASQEAAVFLGLPSAGQVTYQQSLPGGLAFAGMSLRFQGAAIQAGGNNALGLVLSNGHEAVIGVR